jgi:hypothetical protein
MENNNLNIYKMSSDYTLVHILIVVKKQNKSSKNTMKTITYFSTMDYLRIPISISVCIYS